MGNETPRWFEEGSTSKDLERPQELARTHRSFRDRFQSFTRGKNGEARLASTKEELLEQIDRSSSVVPRRVSRRTSAIQHLRRASAAHNDYAAARQHGAKKAGVWAQEYASTFGQFVEKYSKVVEAVASAGGPYGTVAYQTLSILLAVCVNKAKNDTRVITMLDELRKSMPRMANWDSIYPTDEMRSLVTKSYTLITEFCRQAAEYLSRFWKRLLPAFAPMLGYNFDILTGDIHKTLAEVNDEAMYGLHQRSQRTEDQVAGSRKLIEDLKSQAEDAEKVRQTLLDQNKELLLQSEEAERSRQKLLAQNRELKEELERQGLRSELRDKQEDRRRLQAFETFLGAEGTHPGTDVVLTKMALMDVFPDVPHNPHLVAHTGYLQMSRNLLEHCEQYNFWDKSDRSSLLLLSGRTDWHGRRRTGCVHCWLSPVTIYLKDDLQQSHSKVAFFSCLPGYGACHTSAATILSSIILQVLQWRPEMLRDDDETFRRVLEKRDGSWSIASLVELLELALAGLRRDKEEETVYIIIDRLDRCHDEPNEAVLAVLDGFAGLVTAFSDPAFRVKVLVVAETWGYDTVEWRGDMLSRLRYDPKRLHARQHWDQRRLMTTDWSGKPRPRIWSSDSSVSAVTV